MRRLRNIKKSLGEPSEPWKRACFIGGSGVFAGGWTNDDKIFLLNTDYYIVGNPRTGEREMLVEDDNILNYLSKDNLEFELKEFSQKIKIFGLRGGNGNHYTSDKWKLIEVLQDSQNKIFGISGNRIFSSYDKFFWKNFDLIKLNNLEFGEWCGFSPNEKYFAIFGSGGVEVFNRN